MAMWYQPHESIILKLYHNRVYIIYKPVEYNYSRNHDIITLFHKSLYILRFENRYAVCAPKLCCHRYKQYIINYFIYRRYCKMRVYNIIIIQYLYTDNDYNIVYYFTYLLLLFNEFLIIPRYPNLLYHAYSIRNKKVD